MSFTKGSWSILAGTVALASIPGECRADDNLGSADTFAVLAGAGVTSTGDTVLNGDLGVSAGMTFTGFPPGVVNGTTYTGGAVEAQAENDAHAAYNTLGALGGATSIATDLGGLTLTPGVYDFASSAQLTGTLTLNAEGNPSAQFIFQIGSTLTTASSSLVVLENDAQADSVSWVVGSSATLGSGTDFAGEILADQSITMDDGASLSGNAVALNGTVSLDHNDITTSVLPEPNSFLSGGLVVAILASVRGLVVWRRNQPGSSKTKP